MILALWFLVLITRRGVKFPFHIYYGRASDDVEVLPISSIRKGNVTIRKPRKPKQGKGVPVDSQLSSINPQVSSLFDCGLDKDFTFNHSHFLVLRGSTDFESVPQ